MNYIEKSFDAAFESSKLLITLSTALVAFCATVVNIEVNKPMAFTPVSMYEKGALASCWIFLVFAAGCGVWTLLAITDVLANADVKKPPTAWARKITVPFMSQILLFMLGVIGLTLYGIAKLAP